MSFTRSTTDVYVHRNMPDFPTGEGISASDLKTAFDSEAEGLQTDLNRLETELEDATAAANLGAGPIVDGDTSDGNIQAKLNKLHEELEEAVLGEIPDGSITQAKLNATYEGTLAKKNGTLQTGLNTEKLNGKTEAQLKTAFLGTLNPTTVNISSLSQGSGTATETKTVATSGCRYYIIVNSFYKVILYDAKSQKFVFSIPTSDNSQYSQEYAYNTPTIRLYGANGDNSRITLTAAYSGTTLTLNVTKATTSSKSTPAGTLTIFELGGIV